MALTEAVTKYGVVLGQPSANQRVSVFKGIPFAKAPVGDLRWKAPERMEPFDKPYKAYSFGPIPYQYRVPAGSMTENEFYPYKWDMSEDCLYLNVWTPARKPDEKLPVAVWIFGGGFSRGYSNKQETDGDSFARRGCVYVDFNYRLGVFGFMGSSALAKENEHDSSGNYGLLDQMAALSWIRENISAFGGDPDRVTIFGQSAGAMSCLSLMTSPLSRDLFHQVIMESGGGLAPIRFSGQRSRTVNEACGDAFLSYCNVKTLSEARSIPTDELYRKSLSFMKEYRNNPGFWPFIDGYVIPEDPNEVIRKNALHDYPIIIGHNIREDSFNPVTPMAEARTPEEAHEWIERNKPDYAARIKDAEQLKTEEDVHRYMTFMMDRMLKPGSYAFADVYTRLKKNTKLFLYRFDHVPPGGPDVGCYHSAEKMYIFETICRTDRPMTADDYKLSLDMADYWSNFVKNGDPNGKGLAYWEAYDPDRPRLMALDVNSRMEDVQLDHCLKTYKDILVTDTAALV